MSNQFEDRKHFLLGANRPEECFVAIEQSDVRQIRNLRIAIVGGGTAGWMTAATLQRRLRCDITVIESARIAPIGVGEATIPSLVDWIENMQIDEDWFLRQTNGTYKLAIRFDNWIAREHRYWHPFGLAGVNVDGLDWIHLWEHARRQGWKGISPCYSDYCLQQQLCLDDLAPRQCMQPSVVANYAYHLDAGKLANFLKSIAVAEGVKHCIGDVVGAAINEVGELSSVQLQDQPAIHADLFIDCSGFSGVLIDRTLNVDWIDWSDQLLCDRAITVRTQRTEKTIHPYTVSTGLDCGWSWQIPLTANTGNGYVYSSRHLSRDAAARELSEQLGINEATADLREVKFRTGCRRTTWERNCVAIGLSAGFVEPLESTGIFLVQRAIDDLVEAISKGANQAEQNRFNVKMETLYQEIRDFVLLHYVLSRRKDTAFWRDAATVALPESLQVAIERYQAGGAIARDPASCFADANHHFIYAGAGIAARSDQNVDARRLLAKLGDQRLLELFRRITTQQTYLRSRLPSHHELLSQIHLPAMATAA